MCISIGCVNGSPKSDIPSVLERSEGWDTVWRCFHEERAYAQDGCYGNARAFASDQYVHWCLFPDGMALPHHWLYSPCLFGTSDQFPVGCGVLCPLSRWPLLDRVEAWGTREAYGTLRTNFRGDRAHCQGRFSPQARSYPGKQCLYQRIGKKRESDGRGIEPDGAPAAGVHLHCFA